MKRCTCHQQHEREQLLHRRDDRSQYGAPSHASTDRKNNRSRRNRRGDLFLSTPWHGAPINCHQTSSFRRSRNPRGCQIVRSNCRCGGPPPVKALPAQHRNLYQSFQKIQWIQPHPPASESCGRKKLPYGSWGGDQKGTACHGNSGITADSDWTRSVASDADTYYYSVCTVEQVTVNHLVGGSSPSRGANNQRLTPTFRKPLSHR